MPKIDLHRIERRPGQEAPNYARDVPSVLLMYCRQQIRGRMPVDHRSAFSQRCHTGGILAAVGRVDSHCEHRRHRQGLQGRHRDDRQAVGIDLGLVLLLLPLLFRGEPQLLARTLEFLLALLLRRRVDVLRGQALDGDARVLAVGRIARLFGVLVALHHDAVQGHPILHEVLDRHRRNSARRTRGGPHEGHTKIAKAENLLGRVSHRASRSHGTEIAPECDSWPVTRITA